MILLPLRLCQGFTLAGTFVSSYITSEYPAQTLNFIGPRAQQGASWLGCKITVTHLRWEES